MAIQDSDLFLIEDGGVSKKIRADKLKGGLDSTYGDMLLLVNKPDFSSRYVKCSDLQTNLPDDHWVMVERSDVSYKVSGTKVHDYFPSGPAGATGVIIDSHTTPITNGETGTHDLTVASLATPNFADNESVRMVNVDGDTSSYLPVTNTITNVVEKIADYSQYMVPFTGQSDATTAFNGQINGGAEGSYYAPAGGEATWTPPSPIAFTTLMIHGGVHVATGDGTIEVNGIDLTDLFPEGFMTDPNEIGAIDISNAVTSPLRTIKVTSNIDGRGFALAGVRLDGYLLVDGNTETTLTFEDPCPDLKFFQPGDVVQIGYSGTPAWYGANNCRQTDGAAAWFDGNDNTAGTVLTDHAAWVGTINFNTSFAIANENDRVFETDSLKNTGTVTITHGPNNTRTDVTAQLPATSNADICTSSVPLTTLTGITSPVTSIELLSNGEFANGIVQIAVDGSVLTTAPADSKFYGQLAEVKVITRDPESNTMMVDGGLWLGSDGTSSGNAADQETFVTGPSKSGTAKADGVPASTTFRIKASNGEWIDNTNSNSGADHSGASAQEFYVKNNSGRVSTARLLETAMEIATAWQAATGYAEGAFVEHDGVYWYALSSSYDNSPDDNDPLDWLRLS